MASMKAMSVVAILVLAAAMAMTATAQETCVNNLVPCVDYLNGTKPSTVCCDSIKETVAKELPCLCSVYNSPGLLQSFNVSVDQALALTRNCGVPVRLDQCSSAPSPQALTPGVPGGDKNGSDRRGFVGFCSVFAFFVAAMF